MQQHGRLSGDITDERELRRHPRLQHAAEQRPSGGDAAMVLSVDAKMREIPLSLDLVREVAKRRARSRSTRARANPWRSRVAMASTLIP